jgi:hypothetical protein
VYGDVLVYCLLGYSCACFLIIIVLTEHAPSSSENALMVGGVMTSVFTGLRNRLAISQCEGDGKPLNGARKARNSSSRSGTILIGFDDRHLEASAGWINCRVYTK